jgi:hypothetical protein
MPALLTTGLFVAEQLLRYAPGLFAQFQTIIATKDVTADEIRAKRHALAAQKFEDLVPHSELPPEA